MREDIKIIFEDNHILVVSKPPFVPVQEDESGDEDMLTALKKYLIEKYNKPGDAFLGLVHRLDRPTGGVMVFAKTSKAAARLSEAIRNGEVEKRYLTVVHGEPRDKQRKLVNYLKKYPEINTVKVVPSLTEGAKYAELDYKVLDTKEGMSLVLVNLITGRSHQIRVQMATIGHSVVGDCKYGNDENLKLPICLWAAELRFSHPISGQKMVFKVYPPEDLPYWNLFDIDQYLRISVKNDATLDVTDTTIENYDK
ncbi:MAG: RNA pseudouridine synthase [Clostridia bacterium]|nr:RNA pseudouridine synthase [Clostridia bacterium]